ncbi:MAG: prepilin-type N-terminal cleavage/methylation domain-containing protein [Symbiopectobacterium sp.]
MYAAGRGGEILTLLEHGLFPGWQLDLTKQFQTAACLRISSTVITPQHYQARLYRWFCFTDTNQSEPCLRAIDGELDLRAPKRES